MASPTKSRDSKSRTSNTTASKPAKRGATGQPRGDRSKRLLDLVMLLLRASSPVTFREIREQFLSYKTANVEAGLRAFERDKADLLDLGVPIRYVTPDEDDALEEGGYVIEMKRYRLPEVQLTAEEVSALVLAAEVARAVPGGSYGDIVDLALKKLAFDLPEPPDTPGHFPATVEPKPVVVHFPPDTGRKARELSERFASLEAATRNRKRVMLQYRSAAEAIVKHRDVDPYGLYCREGKWLLVGHCHLSDDVRSFRLDRIVDMKIAPKPKSPDFTRPPEFDVRRYASRSPWTFASTTEPESVELEFKPEVASASNEDFGSEAHRTDGPDGTVRVRFSCTNPEYAASRILEAKGAIRIRRGPRLRQQLSAELTAVRAMYRE